jgi:hypothetical protein
MAILKDMLKEELDRLTRMENSYIQKIDSLPKGSIINKSINGKKYAYLVYRSGLKVVTQYIKPEELDDLKKKVEQRNKYKKDLQEIRKDIKVAKKVVRV